ncbi:MAG: hypothetical protein MRZ79_11675 [Bacteroidia bacterium]|nr:hypothetical protein [Bacteroidia bacterium]
MKLKIVSVLGFVWLLILPNSNFGQRIISSIKLKKFPVNEPVIYPYQTPSVGSEEVYVQHDPSIRLSDGSFVHIWEKSWSRHGYRELTHYDLFLEEISSGELKLERQEDILYSHPEDTVLHLFTYEYDFGSARHHIRHRKIGISSAEILDTESVWMSYGKYGELVSHKLSPDKRFLLLYQPIGYKLGSKSYYLEDVVFNYENVQPIHTRTGGVVFSVFDLENNKKLVNDTLKWDNKKKWIFFGSGVDNNGNVYAGIYDRKKEFHVHGWNVEKAKQERLIYDEFPVWKDLLNLYSGFRNIQVGMDSKVYVTQTNRISSGKLRGIQNFQVISFDFKEMNVDLKRRVDISSALKVQVGKVREEFGLKANRRFDNYLITDLIELSDQSLWLMVQSYGLNNSSVSMVDFPRRGRYEEFAEELIMFEFSPVGEIQKALVIPSFQRSTGILDRKGYFYHTEVDEEKKLMRMLTREASGDKLRGPDRLYLREIDLEKGVSSERKMVYAGKRRDQYFLKAFAEWLNNDLLSVVILEGVRGKAYLVTVNTGQEPEEEEEK